MKSFFYLIGGTSGRSVAEKEEHVKKHRINTVGVSRPDVHPHLTVDTRENTPALPSTNSFKRSLRCSQTAVYSVRPVRTPRVTRCFRFIGTLISRCLFVWLLFSHRMSVLSGTQATSVQPRTSNHLLQTSRHNSFPPEQSDLWDLQAVS